MRMRGELARRLAVFILGAGTVLSGRAEEVGDAFSLSRTEDGYELKTPDGRTVFQYMTTKPKDTKLTASSTCCFYPVLTPKGTRVVDFAPDDHPHHRGMFLAWHNIQGSPGGDFWGWGEFAPTEGRVIRNKLVTLSAADDVSARLRVENVWLAGDKVVFDEKLTVLVREEENSYVLDLAYTLTPGSDLTLGRTAFSGFNVKSRKARGSYTGPEGVVKLPDPHYLKPETDWPSRPWYDYSFELDDGKKAGVTVIDHEDNPRTAWHNLKPIAMLNPCIVAPGEVKRRAGDPLVLKYKVVAHDGPAPVELANKLARGYARK